MDVSAALERALAAPVESLSRSELDAFGAEVRAVRSWCDAAEVRIARRVGALDASLDDVLGRAGRRSGREVRVVAAREEACTLVPALETALAAGSVTAAHVDAVAAAVRHLDPSVQSAFASYEASLVRAAQVQGVTEFTRSARDLARQLLGQHNSEVSDAERLARQRKQSKVRRWVDELTGMHHTHVELDPERDEKWWTAIKAQLGRLRQQDGNRGTPFGQLEVDAIVAASGPGDDRIPEIAIHIDWQSLLTGAHALGLCETVDGVPMPITTVRRLCCDAQIIPVVLGSDGEVLDLGRQVRTSNRAQRRALRAMHRTCGHPGCTVPFEACRIHHVVWWFRGGASDLANLLPLCEKHHHLVHEGGWTLAMGADRVATWTRPDGTVFHRGRTTDRTPAPLVEPRARDAPVAVAS